jgi:hypothetical protein
MTAAVLPLIGRVAVSVLPKLADSMAGAGVDAARMGEMMGTIGGHALITHFATAGKEAGQKAGLLADEGFADGLSSGAKANKAMQQIAEQSGDAFKGLGGTIAADFMNTFNTVLSGQTPDLSQIIAPFNQLEEAVTGPIMAITKHIPLLGDAMQSMKNNFDTGVAAAGGFAQALVDVGDQYIETGKKIAESVVDVSQLDKLTESVRNVVSSGAIVRFKDIEESIGRLATNIPNISTGQLERLVTQLAMAEEIVGEIDAADFAGVLAAWDMNAGQAESALQTLVNTARLTGEPIAQIARQMETVGPSMRVFGYSAAQTGQFFAEMAKQGEPSKNAVYMWTQAVKEATASGLEPKTWLKMQIDAVRQYAGSGQLAEARKLVEDSFGQRGSPLVTEAIMKVIIDTPDMMDPMKGLEASVPEALNYTNTLEDAFVALGQQIQAAMAPVGMILDKALVEKLGDVSEWMAKHQAEILGWVTTISDHILGAVQDIMEFTAGALQLVSSFINPVKEVVLGFFGSIVGMAEASLNMLSKLPDFLGGESFGRMRTVFADTKNTMREIADIDMGGKVYAFGDTVGGLADKIPGLREQLRGLSADEQDQLRVTGALTQEMNGALGPAFDQLTNEKGELIKGSPTSPAMKLLGTPQQQQQMKDDLAKMGVNIKAQSAGVITEVTFANQKAMDIWAKWYTDMERDGVEAMVKLQAANKSGVPIDGVDELVGDSEGVKVKLLPEGVVLQNGVPTPAHGPGGVTNLPTAPVPGTAPANPAAVGTATGDAMAAEFVKQATAAGMNREQILAGLSVLSQETGFGTNPNTNAVQNQNGTPGITGPFQQDTSYTKYGNRQDPATAIRGFIDQFVHTGDGLNDPLPFRQALDVQRPAKTPALGGDGYDDRGSGDGAYLQGQQRATAEAVLNRVGGANLPVVTSPGGPAVPVVPVAPGPVQTVPFQPTGPAVSAPSIPAAPAPAAPVAPVVPVAPAPAAPSVPVAPAPVATGDTPPAGPPGSTGKVGNKVWSIRPDGQAEWRMSYGNPTSPPDGYPGVAASTPASAAPPPPAAPATSVAPLPAAPPVAPVVAQGPVTYIAEAGGYVDGHGTVFSDKEAKQPTGKQWNGPGKLVEVPKAAPIPVATPTGPAGMPTLPGVDTAPGGIPRAAPQVQKPVPPPETVTLTEEEFRKQGGYNDGAPLPANAVQWTQDPASGMWTAVDSEGKPVKPGERQRAPEHPVTKVPKSMKDYLGSITAKAPDGSPQAQLPQMPQLSSPPTPPAPQYKTDREPARKAGQALGTVWDATKNAYTSLVDETKIDKQPKLTPYAEDKMRGLEALPGKVFGWFKDQLSKPIPPPDPKLTEGEAWILNHRMAAAKALGGPIVKLAGGGAADPNDFFDDWFNEDKHIESAYPGGWYSDAMGNKVGGLPLGPRWDHYEGPDPTKIGTVYTPEQWLAEAYPTQPSSKNQLGGPIGLEEGGSVWPDLSDPSKSKVEKMTWWDRIKATFGFEEGGSLWPDLGDASKSNVDEWSWWDRIKATFGYAEGGVVGLEGGGRLSPVHHPKSEDNWLWDQVKKELAHSKASLGLDFDNEYDGDVDQHAYPPTKLTPKDLTQARMWYRIIFGGGPEIPWSGGPGEGDPWGGKPQPPPPEGFEPPPEFEDALRPRFAPPRPPMIRFMPPLQLGGAVHFDKGGWAASPAPSPTIDDAHGHPLTEERLASERNTWQVRLWEKMFGKGSGEWMVGIMPNENPHLGTDLPHFDKGGAGDGTLDKSAADSPLWGANKMRENADPFIQKLGDQMHAAYPTLQLWGWNLEPGEHPSGKALDVVTGDTPGGLALGDSITAQMMQTPGIRYVIFKQAQHNPDGTVEPYKSKGDRNLDHFTHPHIRAFQVGGDVPWLPGTDRGKDGVHAILAPGEHIWTDKEVDAAGGHSVMYAMRRAAMSGKLGPKRMQAGGALDTAGAQVNTIAVGYGVLQAYGISDIGMYRQPDSPAEHSSGVAADVMVGLNNPVGNNVNQFALQNAGQYGVNFTIWQNKVWKPDGSVKDYGHDPVANPTDAHMDHVHINTTGGGYPPGGGPGQYGTGGRPSSEMTSTPAPAAAMLLQSGTLPASAGAGAGTTNAAGVAMPAAGSLPNTSIGTTGPGAGLPGNPWTDMPGGLTTAQQNEYTQKWLQYQTAQNNAQQAVLEATKDLATKTQEAADAEAAAVAAEKARQDALTRAGPVGSPAYNQLQYNDDFIKLTKDANEKRVQADAAAAAKDEASRSAIEAGNAKQIADLEAPPDAPKKDKTKGAPMAKELGQGLVEGVLQELGFPDVFGDFITEWGSWKLAMGGLGFGLGLAKNKGWIGSQDPATDNASVAAGGGAGALNIPFNPADLASQPFQMSPSQDPVNVPVGAGAQTHLSITNNMNPFVASPDVNNVIQTQQNLTSNPHVVAAPGPLPMP